MIWGFPSIIAGLPLPLVANTLNEILVKVTDVEMSHLWEKMGELGSPVSLVISRLFNTVFQNHSQASALMSTKTTLLFLPFYFKPLVCSHAEIIQNVSLKTGSVSLKTSTLKLWLYAPLVFHVLSQLKASNATIPVSLCDHKHITPQGHTFTVWRVTRVPACHE